MRQFVPYGIYGIIGYPLGHSMSPLIHTTSFHDHGIPAVLVPFPTPPDDIALLVQSVRLLNIQGLCVTIPHKQTVMPYLDEVTVRAKKAGAVNLIYKQGDKLCGDNTDIVGFMAPLKKESLLATKQKVLLLGAGGAARAAIVGLHELDQTDITVAIHSTHLPKKFMDEFDLKVVPWDKRRHIDAQLIINSTPLGMKGKFEGHSGYESEWFTGKGVAYDLVYTPRNTRFLQDAQRAGWLSISGQDMFINQANEQFKIWTGKDLSDNAKQAVMDQLAS